MDPLQAGFRDWVHPGCVQTKSREGQLNTQVSSQTYVFTQHTEVTKIISTIVVTLVTPKTGAKHDKPASEVSLLNI
jgi:hypothetical protein